MEPLCPTRPPVRTEGKGDKPDGAGVAGTTDGAPATRERSARESATGGGRILVCVRCGRPITTTGDRIEVDGLHEHTQINPHGYIWTFACFARAPGCVPVGAPSREFAWFAGTSWQIADCGGCRLHLGWLFTAPVRRFHGLITERIVERHEERPS